MQALVLTVPASESELAADLLWSLGVLAIEERGRPDTDDGMVELWTGVGDDVEPLLTELEALPARWRWKVVEVDDAIVDSWRAHAVASWITPDLVVLPSWIDHPTTGPDVTIVRIDPGQAFGLGDHPTTVLTLRALRAVMWPGATVLDVGCGSGVLGVAAAVLGASYVESIDVSPAAIAATRANAERNGVAGRVQASTTALAQVVGPFDIVLANILAPALVDLAPELRRATGPSGVLVVSGVLDRAHDHVTEALSPMHVVDRLVREGWAAVVLRH